MLNFPGKQYIRGLAASLRRAVDDYQLSRCVDALRSGAPIDREVLRTARRAWGNEAWSADLRYLEEATARVARCTVPILECGTGLTTLLACAVAERNRVPVYSLEQDRQWANVVERALERHRLVVHVSYAPLVRYGNFVWYDLTGIDLPRRFGLVLCDGPAVLEPWSREIQLQWRVGVLPVLAAKGITTDEVLLDDADEPRAPRLMEHWRREFGCEEHIIATSDGDIAVMRPTASLRTPS